MAKKNARIVASADVLQSLFENGKSPLSDQFLRWKVWLKWPDIVGHVAEHSRPVGYHKGTLVVWTKNSTWLHHLLFFRDMIQENVNKHVGRPWVQKVHITADRRHVPDISEMEENAKKFIES